MASNFVLILPVRVTILIFAFVESNVGFALIIVRETSWSSHAFVECWFTVGTNGIIISCTVFNVCETSSRAFFFMIICLTVITKSINVIIAMVDVGIAFVVIVSCMITWISLIKNIVNLRSTEADLIITSRSISSRNLSSITAQANCSLLQLTWRNCDRVLDTWLLVTSSISQNTKLKVRIKVIFTV